MQDVSIGWTLAFLAGLLGLVAGAFSKRFPKRGLFALGLVLLAGILVPFIDSPEAAAPPRSPPLFGFMFLAPLSPAFTLVGASAKHPTDGQHWPR